MEHGSVWIMKHVFQNPQPAVLKIYGSYSINNHMEKCWNTGILPKNPWRNWQMKNEVWDFKWNVTTINFNAPWKCIHQTDLLTCKEHKDEPLKALICQCQLWQWQDDMRKWGKAKFESSFCVLPSEHGCDGTESVKAK